MPVANSFSPDRLFSGCRRLIRQLLLLFTGRYGLFLLVLFTYTWLVEQSGGFLGGWVWLRQYLEVLLLLYLYWYFNTIIKPSAWRPILAAAPILLAYIGQDIYYLMLNKVFRVVELSEVTELLNVTSTKYLVVIVLAGTVTAAGFLVCVNFRRPVVLVAGFLPIILLLYSVEYTPQGALSVFQRIGRPVINWSDTIPVEENGRLVMLLYREAQRRITLAKTVMFHDRASYDEKARQRAAWLESVGSRRNVHVIVMESLVDPSLFNKAVFSRDPVHPDFRKLFGDNGGFSISPVFGGKTSQAEFELLCGVPAFQELAGVEFNSFSGTPAHCLPGILSQAGYRTIATNTYKPTFFNAVNAYQGIGFGESYFPREFAGPRGSYLSTGDTEKELYMFDGEAFSQNLAFVEQALAAEPDKPLFNYVLTMYGHLPYLLDSTKRPTVVKLLGPASDAMLERVANQFYYRSQAIAAYVRQLIAMDPQSLIVVVSDHLPPLQGFNTYKKFEYLDGQLESIHVNRLFIVEDGQVQKLTTIHHYDIPSVILNYLSKGRYCQTESCGFAEGKLLEDRESRRTDYLRLMAHAIQ